MNGDQTRLIRLSYLLDNTASEKYFKELGFSYISTSFFTNSFKQKGERLNILDSSASDEGSKEI